MTSKVRRWLVGGVVSAIVVTVAVLWWGRSDEPFPTLAAEAAKRALQSGRQSPERVKSSVAPEPEVDGAVGVSPPVLMPPSLNISSRPDAGYYTHPTRRYGVSGLLLFSGLIPQDVADRQAAINRIVQITHVDEGSANEFFIYMQLALQDLRAYQDIVAAEPCKQRDSIRTIKQLADAVTSVDVAVEVRRAQMTRGSEKILGAAGMKNLEVYMSSKDRDAKLHVNRNEERLRATGKTVPEILNDICAVR